MYIIVHVNVRESLLYLIPLTNKGEIDRTVSVQEERRALTHEQKQAIVGRITSEVVVWSPIRPVEVDE